MNNKFRILTIFISFMGFGIFGCDTMQLLGSKITPNIHPTLLPVEQLTVSVTITASPSKIIPSLTPPTPTTTPIPAWIKEFAEPILKAIANRSPSYQDDFSNPASGWYNGPTSGQPNVKIAGDKRYWHGEYIISAEGATSIDPTICAGVEDSNVGLYADFVAEFDVRFISGKTGGWLIQFHRNSIGLYQLGLNRIGEIKFSKCMEGIGDCPQLGETMQGGPIKLGEDWNHIQLIVRVPKMAAYINGAPFIYAEDKSGTAEILKGYFSLNVCNTGDVPMETRWDNFRVWNISNLP
jgi:hypothetical protein